MPYSEDVLVFDGSRDHAHGLALRLRGIGIRPVVAKSSDEALELVTDRRYRFGAALVHREVPVVDLAAALEELRALGYVQ